jgi:hypothetical protein
MAQWKQEKKELEEKLAAAESKLAERTNAPTSIPEDPVGFPEPTPPANEPVADAPKDKLEELKDRASKMGVTKPWEQLDSATPWKMDMLKMRRTRPGFVPRWVREDKVEHRLAMGYTIADRKDYETFQSPAQFGSPSASYITRGELVLMEIPVEGYEAYKAALRKRTQMASEDAKRRMRAQVIEIAKEQGISPEDIQLTDETKTTVE